MYSYFISRYWRQRKQADRDLEQGRAGPAAAHLTRAAECLGRGVPCSTMDCVASLLCQLVVLVLDTVRLLPLLRRLGGGGESREREGRWQAAETFHRLHQVRRLDTVSASSPPACAGRAEHPW